MNQEQLYKELENYMNTHNLVVYSEEMKEASIDIKPIAEYFYKLGRNERAKEDKRSVLVVGIGEKQKALDLIKPELLETVSIVTCKEIPANLRETYIEMVNEQKNKEIVEQLRKSAESLLNTGNYMPDYSNGYEYHSRRERRKRERKSRK